MAGAVAVGLADVFRGDEAAVIDGHRGLLFHTLSSFKDDKDLVTAETRTKQRRPEVENAWPPPALGHLGSDSSQKAGLWVFLSPSLLGQAPGVLEH